MINGAVKKVLVTGGAGYKGAVLVPKLLEAGYEVTVLDWFLYGNNVFAGVKDRRNLHEVKGDIRDSGLMSQLMAGQDAVIHFACISNDPSVELDPALSKSVNLDAFEPIIKSARDSGVKRFIFAASSSVYGVSDQPNIMEDHPHVPITDYNKYKSMCEKIMWDYKQDDFVVTSVRPATVCGYSPRLRLDLTVNILTNNAVNLKKITVFGGQQMRPNIHIEDITDLYVLLLTAPVEKINGEAFNAGYENHKVEELAHIVKRVVEMELPELGPIAIEFTPSDDIRSYHISSEKVKRTLGFAPKRTIEDAVHDLISAFKEARIPNSMENPIYYNIKTMQRERVR